MVMSVNGLANAALLLQSTCLYKRRICAVESRCNGHLANIWAFTRMIFTLQAFARNPEFCMQTYEITWLSIRACVPHHTQSELLREAEYPL